ncbi:malectin, partial [bacterium]|nr:malectin [bacterium]
ELPLYVKNTGGGSLSWSAAENPDMSWLVSMSAISGTLAADEVDTVLVTVSRSGMAEEEYTGQISVTSGAGSANVAVHMTVVDFPPYNQRINAGGDSYTDGAGHLWVADRAYSAGSFGFVGGETYHSRDDVANTDDDELYQSERYGMDAYRFDVRAGTYQVILHFAETYHRSAGKRVFSVMAEGMPIVQNLDIFARAGHDAAMSITSSEFYITDGSLDLTFTASTDDPKISAIEVTSIMTDPILAVSPDSLIFGSIRDTLQTTIRNTGRNTLNWSMSDLSNSSWITRISPSSGSVGSGLFQKVVVEVSRNELAQGDYNGLIRLSSNAGSQDMPVKMRVPGPAALAVNVDTLNFGDSERTLTFAVSNQGAGTVSWQLAENPEKVWITSISQTSGTLQADEVTYVSVTVARYGQNAGDYTGLISITSDAGNDDVVVNMSVVDLPPYSNRINAGGNSYQDGDGNIWVADQEYVLGGFGYVGGDVYQVSYSISYTDDDVLFQSEHFGMEAYRFTVPDGWYNVALLFAENYYRETGRRVMDVAIEGQPVLEDFDIFKESGGRNYAMEQIFTDIFVQDGVLDISFTGLVDEAKISAIAIGSFNKSANLVIEPDSLNYGVGLDTLHFEIANSGNASLNWTIDPIAPESWITQIVPMSGSVAESAQQEIMVIIDRGELPEDDYTDNIHVSSNGGADDLIVTMSVPGPPTLVVSLPDLNFSTDESCLTFQVRNAGGGSLAWSAVESPEKSWITTVNPASGSLDTGKSATVTVCLDRDGLDEGDYYSQVRIIGVGVEPDTQYVSISMRVEKVPPYTMRINAGGGNYTDVSGLSWTADQAFAVGSYGYIAGEPGRTYDNITNTEADILYQTERFGMEAYRFEVPEGTYEITLHFAEIYATWTGRRLMSVTIEDIPVLEDFDIYQAVGHDAAVVRSYSNILVTDGVLDVEFSASKEDAKISAIEVTAYENEPVLSVAPDTLDFSSVMDTLAVLVTNTGRQTLNWSVSEDPDEPWLTKVLPTAGSLPPGANQAVSVIVDREEIETIGEYFTRLNFASNGGSRSIPIRVKKPGPPLLLVTPLTLDFGTSESMMTFKVKNDGGDMLIWSAGENPDQTWITAITPPAGELGPDDSRTVSVRISREEMDVGEYSGIIRIVTETDSAEIDVQMEVPSG